MKMLAETDKVLWPASLQLGFVRNGHKTIFAKRNSHGPLRVLKPLYPEQDVCHVYILHPPGGVAGGDEIVIDIDVEQGAHALLTTPAAGKFYRSAGLKARQQQLLHVADGGILEWLPQETLLFGGSRVDSQTEIRLTSGSRFIGMELFGLGRPASGDHYQNAFFDNSVHLSIDDNPLISERLHLIPDADILHSNWGLAGKKIFGTLCATPATGVDIDQLKSSLDQFDQRHWAVTCMTNVLMVRYLGDHTEQGLQILREAWRAIRPAVVGRQACAPRIWNT